jgi:hypothetical protein
MDGPRVTAPSCYGATTSDRSPDNLHLKVGVSGAAQSQSARAMALAVLSVSSCVLVPQPQIAHRARYLPRMASKEKERNGVYQ